MANQVDTGSTSFRFVLIGALTLASLIPLGLVSCVASDRSNNYESAVNSIGMSWGREQRISGPVILIPIESKQDGGAAFVAVMPETFRLHMVSTHDVRKRGIFEVPVFELEASASGSFPALDLDELEQRYGPLRTDQTAVFVGISDTRGIRTADLRWGGQEKDLVPLPNGPFGSGISASLGRSLGGVVQLDLSSRDFEVDLILRGTRRFSVVANGDTSNITMESSWPHPSFMGRFLPDEREVGPSGFTASYTVSGLARGFPSIFRVFESGGDTGFAKESLGFDAFEPVNLYSSVSRSVKYGILFVALTLVGLLCLELSTGIRFLPGAIRRDHYCSGTVLHDLAGAGRVHRIYAQLPAFRRVVDGHDYLVCTWNHQEASADFAGCLDPGGAVRGDVPLVAPGVVLVVGRNGGVAAYSGDTDAHHPATQAFGKKRRQGLTVGRIRLLKRGLGSNRN